VAATRARPGTFISNFITPLREADSFQPAMPCRPRRLRARHGARRGARATTHKNTMTDSQKFRNDPAPVSRRGAFFAFASRAPRDHLPIAAAIACLAIGLAAVTFAGCSKKEAAPIADGPAPSTKELARDEWHDDAAAAAMEKDGGKKNIYVCVFKFSDMNQRPTSVVAMDRPKIGAKKVSMNEESIQATSADQAHKIAEIAVNYSLEIGPCTRDSSGTAIDKSVPLSSYADLKSGLQLGLLYYGLGGKSLPAEDLAGSFDPDYQSTADTFKRQDLFKAIQPQMEAQEKQELASPYFKIKVAAALGHYDAQTKSFPLLQLGMDGNSRITLYNAPDYGLVLRGDVRLDSITPASEDQARALEAKVSASGAIQLPVDVDVYVEVLDTLTYASRKDVVGQVVALHVSEQQTGTVIADLQ